MKKIIIAGGTGFLGSCLQNYYSGKDVQLIILTRKPSRIVNNVQFIHWDGKTIGSWRCALEGAHAIINLNGKSVDCRYTEVNKKLIYSTRLDATAAIGKAIQSCEDPPRLWINASSATITDIHLIKRWTNILVNLVRDFPLTCARNGRVHLMNQQLRERERC